MYNKFLDFLHDKTRLCIIQAENPDGDSLGSAIALDYILDSTENSLYCPVDIPTYLHYFYDWSRVTDEFDYKADGYIIVDTASTTLLSKLLEDTAIRNCLYNKPVLVLDHHETEDDLDFPHESIIEPRPACADLIFHIVKELNSAAIPSTAHPNPSSVAQQPAGADITTQKKPADASATTQNSPATNSSSATLDANPATTNSSQSTHLQLPKPAAEAIYYAISSDTLGLTSASVTADTMRTMADLIDLGAIPVELDENRREFMKKSPRILDYKADLIKRVEYFLDGALATIHIPFSEIQEYSGEYNPSVLIIEELRLVQGVEVAVSVKTYPDGKTTGKIRSSLPVAEEAANYFGGGGHPYAAGFRTYDAGYEDVITDLIRILPPLLDAARAAKQNNANSEEEV